MTLLTREQLEKLNTKRLLAYRNKLLKVVDGPGDDERLGKEDQAWQETYRVLKEVLSTREHVER